MILVIDTALAACQAGLFRADAPLMTASEAMARGHQEALGPMVEALFSRTGTTPRDLSHIGVTLGPGSFTGLRVGLSFAKGMASALGLSLNLGLQGIGTLEALSAHPELADRKTLAVIDGGRGRFYAQTQHAPPQSLDADGLIAYARQQDIKCLTGPAAEAAAGFMPGMPVFAQPWPDLSVLADLTKSGGHDDVTPLYMREADAVASRRGIIDLTALNADSVS